jgi:hypothetical protein
MIDVKLTIMKRYPETVNRRGTDNTMYKIIHYPPMLNDFLKQNTGAMVDISYLEQNI